jgi:tRNA1(Val) A37 N6-methylase TrmN6
MAIFQSSVLKKYLKQLDTDTVAKAYKKYTKYFHDAAIQQNIRESKEEQYQAKFLDELFVSIFGYTLNPQPKFNLTTEFKNIQNARKADGAILQNDAAIAVIELKGTNTKDLESIRKQAFDYKANQPECVYVITSNFEKLRFYINNAVDFEEFDLFALSYSRFELLYLCLHKDNLLQHVPLKIKESSIHEEEAITKTFYNDYSQFKRELFRDIVKRNLRNPELKELGESSSKKELFKKTQKLLDRFLFIFFGEDRGLLPPNSIPKILEQWESLKNMDAYVPLYERYKKYFGYLNDGWKGQQDEIFAYNGGLFKPDPILDTIQIDDDLLFKHTSILTKYDFESQVDVNILGHIFEHSLNEIESVNAEIDGVEFDKQKTKRKKDGVFYTPKYITKYIVDNTVGKLCEEKKAELNIHEEEYLKGPKNRAKTTIQKLDEQLEAYRAWLLTLTICDPACGSGAFLNQALDFLILEHRWVDELSSKLHGGGFVFPDIENSILEKNIYGVDLNDESVEIAKLSLWLRTAQKGRKLTSLNSNIKCGNSLIESKAVAGDKAFSWEKEFPEVFKNGGFDVVIGNPPYVDIKALDPDLVKILFKLYETTENRINLYSIFIEKGYHLLKDKGFLSFINPNSILVNSSYTKIRKMLLDDMTAIIKLPDNVFEDAIVETVIFEFRKKSNITKIKTLVYDKSEKISAVDDIRAKFINKDNWKGTSGWNFNIYVNDDQLKILKTIPKNSVPLKDIAYFSLGITPYDKYTGHTPELIESRGYHSDTRMSDDYKPLISGANIQRYYVLEEVSEYIKYGDWLGAAREEKFFTEPRILVRQIVSGKPPRIYAGYTDKALYYTQIGFGLIPKRDTISVKSLLAIINSSLINFYHKYSFLDLEKDLFQKILIANCKMFPIQKALIENPNHFDSIIDKMIDLKIDLTNHVNSLGNLLISRSNSAEISRKLQNWNELDFTEFIKELEKLRKSSAKENDKEYTKLSLKEESEWMQYFNEQKQKATEIMDQIDKADNEIDRMVYELYGLTEEEIKIVEGS